MDRIIVGTKRWINNSPGGEPFPTLSSDMENDGTSGNIFAVSEVTASSSQEVSASAEEISATMEEFSSHANMLVELSSTSGAELKKFKIS